MTNAPNSLLIGVSGYHAQECAAHFAAKHCGLLRPVASFVKRQLCDFQPSQLTFLFSEDQQELTRWRNRLGALLGTKQGKRTALIIVGSFEGQKVGDRISWSAPA